MNVTFPPDLERFINFMVSKGEYPTPEDVVRAGVARMRGDDADSADEERTRALVREGLEASAQGKTHDGEEVMRALRARFVRMAEENGEAA